MKSCREIEVYLHQKNSSLALEHNEFCIKNYLNWKIIIDIIFKRGNQVFNIPAEDQKENITANDEWPSLDHDEYKFKR